MHEQHHHSESNQGEVNRGRRKFLEKAGFAGVGAATAAASAGSGYRLLMRMLRDEAPNSERAPTDTDDPAVSPEHATAVREHDIEVVAQTLFDQIAEHGSVSLTPETIRGLIAHFKALHSEGGSEHPALLAGLGRMAPWKTHIDAEFDTQGVTPDLSYLAIAESHFDLHAVSHARATGPFQFMKATATKPPASLVVRNSLDERCDPIKSARAAAAVLKDNYWRLGESWDAALAGYNGGFIWRYAQEHQGEEWVYEDFLKHMETEMNKIIAEHDIRIDNNDVYVIQPGDTLRALAIQFDTPVETLKAWNNMHNDMLIAGARFRLSPTNTEHTPKEGMRKLAGYFENMHYPAKFYGILQAIQQLEEQPTVPAHHFQELRISADLPDTLQGVSTRFGIPQDTLITLNPQVRNATAPLPRNTTIRVPAGGRFAML